MAAELGPEALAIRLVIMIIITTMVLMIMGKHQMDVMTNSQFEMVGRWQKIYLLKALERRMLL